MNTQHLKYAIEVERTGSITQAADNLYIGQPSLSKAIKELEDSLGIVIFKRTSKGAAPTEKGAEFLKYARAVMAQIEKMESLYRPGHPDRQELSAAIPRSSYIAQAAAEFVSGLNAEKEVDVSIYETDSMKAIESVIQGRSEIGVISYRVKDEPFFKDYLITHELRSEPLWEYELAVAFSRKHPLAERTPLRAEALFPFVEVVLADETMPYIQVREENRDDLREDKHVHVCDRMNLLEMTARIPGAYIWCAPLPEEILGRYLLTQRKCAGGGRFRDVLICQQGHEFTGVEKRFINKLYECRNRLVFSE